MKNLEKFIVENKLDFDTTGSGLNGACTIISGYALFLGIDGNIEISRVIKKLFPKSEFEDELKRVFLFAYLAGYGEWWKKEEAHKIYKF